MFVEAAVGLAVQESWNRRNRAIAFAKDLFELLSEGRMTIYVFGYGGVGKSTFGKLISGERRLGDRMGEYAVSTEIETSSVRDKSFVVVKVPPGQSPFLDSKWDELVNAMNKSYRLVVVNMIAFGYHSVERTELRDIEGYSTDVAQDAFMEQFLARNRQRELQAFADLVPHLAALPAKFSLISLVAKQDLWWHDRMNVRSFYDGEDGEYTKSVQKIVQRKGRANFVHHLMSASFGRVNFKTKDNHTLASVAAGYDDNILYANYNEFMRVLREAAGLS